MTGGNAHFDVCFESRNWVRPSDAQQAAALRDRRYVRGDGSPVSLAHYCWTHNFFVFGDASATLENVFRRLTGLWTAVPAANQCDDTAMGRLRLGTGAELWLLFHRVVSVEARGSEFDVSVQPTTTGFQIVNVTRPAGTSATFRFLDPGGKLLDTVTERLSLDRVVS